MHPQVLLVLSVRLLFLPHVRFVLVIDEVDDRGPAGTQSAEHDVAVKSNSPVPVVDVVSKTGCINHGKLHWSARL